ncbi:MAG TPA: NYN domain-containing protein [Bdellovibrionota bacterium]|nr:NYN domain-containing protein [Bdellovibrionota bacterium]
MTRILIDGYNLLAVTGHPDREALIRSLVEYRTVKGHQITIVFDGTHGGTGHGDHFQTGGIEVIFSPLTVSADDTIEKMLEKPDASNWIVVSSDRRIQSAADRAHASPISLQEFAGKLRQGSSPASSTVPPWLEGRTDEGPRNENKGASSRLSKICCIKIFLDPLPPRESVSTGRIYAH